MCFRGGGWGSVFFRKVGRCGSITVVLDEVYLHCDVCACQLIPDMLPRVMCLTPRFSQQHSLGHATQHKHIVIHLQRTRGRSCTTYRRICESTCTCPATRIRPIRTNSSVSAVWLSSGSGFIRASRYCTDIDAPTVKQLNKIWVRRAKF